MEYSYPFSTDWSTVEIVDVIRFFEGVEQAYEKELKEKICFRDIVDLKK